MQPCPKCKAELAVFSVVHKDVKTQACYCSPCQTLYTGGVAIPLNEVVKGKMNDVLASAKESASKIADDFKKNPEARIEKYFERVFICAFTEAFCSVFVYFRDRYKDGRLSRIKELWERGINHLSSDQYKEFDALIRMK